MIPLSVRMSGWMRYRDEQVADFSHGRLIAICGENGAGKSSIFDAITFALYGQHRLGPQHVEELISEDMDRASVDFEFEVSGQRYLLHRSRGKKPGERRQSLHLWDEGAHDWTQVAGTEKDGALDLVIAQIVRLNADAFTSSFMLQQGAATSFLDAQPKPRFEIISSLIGLKEYEALEKQARAALTREKGRLEDLTKKLAESDGIDERSLDALRAEVGCATKAEACAARDLAAAQALLADARRYTRLAGDIAALAAQLASCETLISQKEQIERDASVFETLSSAIASVGRVEASLSDSACAAALAEEAARSAAEIDIATLAAAQEQATQRLDAADGSAQIADGDHATAATAERDAHVFAQLAAAVIETRLRVEDCDKQLTVIATDLSAQAGTCEELARGAAVEAANLATNEATLDCAVKDAAAARAAADSLTGQLTERKAAATEAKCSRCGQAIDKKAAKQQIAALTEQLSEAQQRAKASALAEKEANAERAATRVRHEQVIAKQAGSDKRFHGLDGQRIAVASERDRGTVALAQHESRLNGRLQDVDSAQACYESARAQLATALDALECARAELQASRADESAAREALASGKERQATLAAEAAARAQEAASHRRMAETFASGLGDIGENALTDPQGTLAKLKACCSELEDAPARKAALDAAIADKIAWANQQSAKQGEIDAIPEAHRIAEDVAADGAAVSVTAATAARTALTTAQQQLTTLEARIDELARLRQEQGCAAERYRLFKKLADYLGKKGLQGVLVTDALNAITSHANAFLRRLTGGSLQLKLERGAKNDLLELRAIDSTCMREPRSVKALSGSQKFRCAVAIASGIGQYAGAGGMRSIVIDEGFGSLDSEGQRVMVSELKQLATHMDKVIVVSHLEAFTDPVDFPDRIVVETDGDASRIRAAV